MANGTRVELPFWLTQVIHFATLSRIVSFPSHLPFSSRLWRVEEW